MIVESAELLANDNESRVYWLNKRTVQWRGIIIDGSRDASACHARLPNQIWSSDIDKRRLAHVTTPEAKYVRQTNHKLVYSVKLFDERAQPVMDLQRQ